MKVYKATDKNLRCRGFQFEPGKTYKAGKAEICKMGFYACEDPIDLLRYYPPGVGARYFEAELDDVFEREEYSKVVGKKITLGAEIGIPGIAKAHIEYVKQHATTEHTDPKRAVAGYCGTAVAGDGGAAVAGDGGAAVAGYCGAAVAGDGGTATSRGVSAVGKRGLAVARGNYAMAKGGMGAVIVIAVENGHGGIKEWRAGVIDGETLKPDTWYTLKDGEFVEEVE